MSLQVWLPLIQDAHNQGLCGDTLTTSGVTFADGGKLGAKYLSGGTITIPAAVSNTIFNKNNISFAFWLYPIGTSGSGQIMGQSAMSAGNNRMYTIFQYSTPNDLHLSWQDETATNTTFLSGVWTGFFPADTWTHCCITYNGSQAKIYRNGILYTTVNGTSARSVFNYDFPIIGSSIRKLNDVRIYNHCLSLKEVKEISKGLVLHYKLTGTPQSILPSEYQEVEYLESSGTQYINTGYIANTYPLELKAKVSWISAPSSEKDFWGNYNNTSTSGSGYCFVCGGRSTNKWYQWGGSVWDPISNLAVNTIYQTDFIYTGTSGRTAEVNGVAATNSISNNNALAATDGYIGLFSGAGVRAYCCPSIRIYNATIIHENRTVREFIPCYRISDNVAGMYDLIENIFYTNIGSGTFTLGPVIHDVEYDSSGYKNNGQFYSYDLNGTIEELKDTPKYNRSMYINSSDNTTNTASGTKYLYGNCTLINPNNLTITFWCKPIAGYGNATTQGQFCTTNISFGPNAGNDYQNSAMNHRDAAVDINNSAGDTHIRLSVDFTANQWHYYSFTYDGKIARAYKDGVQTATVAFSSNMSLGSFIGIILGFSKAGGVWRSNKSYYSDLRVYATALSADDIKELYQTSASIDNKGNIYAYELEEV